MDVASAKRATLGVFNDDSEGAKEADDAVRGLSVTMAVFLSEADILKEVLQSDVRRRLGDHEAEGKQEEKTEASSVMTSGDTLLPQLLLEIRLRDNRSLSRK